MSIKRVGLWISKVARIEARIYGRHSRLSALGNARLFEFHYGPHMSWLAYVLDDVDLLTQGRWPGILATDTSITRTSSGSDGVVVRQRCRPRLSGQAEHELCGLPSPIPECTRGKRQLDPFVPSTETYLTKMHKYKADTK
jgi:hypothetical protein